MSERINKLRMALRWRYSALLLGAITITCRSAAFDSSRREAASSRLAAQAPELLEELNACLPEAPALYRDDPGSGGEDVKPYYSMAGDCNRWLKSALAPQRRVVF